MSLSPEKEMDWARSRWRMRLKKERSKMMKLRITAMIYIGGRKEVSGRQINGLSAENNVILMATGSMRLSPFPSSRSFIPFYTTLKLLTVSITSVFLNTCTQRSLIWNFSWSCKQQMLIVFFFFLLIEQMCLIPARYWSKQVLGGA